MVVDGGLVAIADDEVGFGQRFGGVAAATLGREASDRGGRKGLVERFRPDASPPDAPASRSATARAAALASSNVPATTSAAGWRAK